MICAGRLCIVRGKAGRVVIMVVGCCISRIPFPTPLGQKKAAPPKKANVDDDNTMFPGPSLVDNYPPPVFLLLLTLALPIPLFQCK
jgi:hypothetical protein